MQRISILILFLSFYLLGQSQVSKEIEVVTAGTLNTLLSSNEKSSVTDLKITGNVDARDFKTMRDSLPLLANLDLTTANISAYSGASGTYSYMTNYLAGAIPQYAFLNTSTYTGKTTLKSVLLPANVSSIGNSAFCYCTGLTSVSIPSSVKSIAYYAFYSCTGLKDIYINSSFPINMGDNWSAFYVNYSQCTLHVPYGAKAGYASAGQWSSFTNIVESPQGFIAGSNKIAIAADAGSFAKIAIKANVAWSASSNQSWLTISPSSGSGNDTLTIIAEANTANAVRKALVTVSSDGYESQTIDVTQKILPRSVNITAGSLSTTLTSDELAYISSISINGTMDARDFKTIRDKMPLLTDLDISGVTISAYRGNEGTSGDTVYAANTIPSNAFYSYYTGGKSLLQFIKIPETTTAIGNYAFDACSGLTSFTIPSSVNKIGNNAFYYCTGLTSLYANSSYPINLSGNYSIFYNVNKSACRLYVPYKSANLYKAAYGWSDFTNVQEDPRGFMTGTNNVKVAYNAGSITTVDISGNVEWTAATDQSWVTVSPASGASDGKLTITALANDSSIRRYARITVSSPGFGTQTITVTQNGAPKSVNLSAGRLSFVLSSEELNAITDLTITGTMDARDVKTMRDLMPELARLDLSKANITAFTGTGGTYDFSTSYAANAFPSNAFFVYSTNYSKTSLVSVKLPASITSIGYSAFQQCTGLTSLFVNNAYPIDLSNSGDPFYNVNKTACSLHVPYATAPLYKASAVWTGFGNIIENTQGFLVTQRTLKFPAALVSKSLSVVVKANVSWTAASDKSWITVNQKDSVLTLTAEANKADTIRIARIIVSASGFDDQFIDVKQAAAPRKVSSGSLATVLTSTELSTLSELALIGSIDSRDFKTMRDNMPKLTEINLTGVTIAGYEGNGGTLWGSGSVKYPANEVPVDAFYCKSSLKTVFLPDTVTSIGDYAFGSVSGLSAITLPSRLRRIGKYSFSRCSGLTSVSLPDSLNIIEEAAFNESSNLSGLKLPNSLKRIGAIAFSNCSSLSGKLSVPASMDSIGASAFYFCYKLDSLEISSPNTFIGGNAFAYCFKISSLKLPDALTTIGPNIFVQCSSLKSINLPSNLKTIGDGAFSGTGLGSITFPASLTSIGAGSFSGSSLTSLVIPSTLTNIGERAFGGCTSLCSVQIPSSLKFLNNSLFEGCTAIKSIELPSALEVLGNSVFAGCSGLTTIVLPSSVKTIGSRAFSTCKALETIYLPDSLKEIKDYTFSGCINLKNINIPSTVAAIRYHAFEECTALRTVILPPTLNAVEDGVFYQCSGLTSVSIPSTVTSIGNEAFYYCQKLQKIDFPSSLNSIGQNAFDDCIGLTSLVFPSSVTSIGRRAFELCTSLQTVVLSDHLKVLADEVFYGCTGISAIDLPKTLTYIGGGCFMNCSALKSIVIPPLITTIGDLVFANCENLNSVTLNSAITCLGAYAFSGCGFKTIELPVSITSLEYEAFAYCKNLTSVLIPPKVTQIGEKAFFSCPSLKSVNIPASVTHLGAGVFSVCSALSAVYAYTSSPIDMSFYGDSFWGVDKTSCILYVPAGKTSAYKAAMYWKDFKNILELSTDVSVTRDSKIILYPNPAKESFMICGVKDGCKVVVYDLKGSALFSKEVFPNEPISIEGLSKGTYMIRITTSEGTIEQKLIKE